MAKLPPASPPGETCTHTQILTFLYRAARGEGAATADDMDKAISWAREKGMINNSFDGSKPCTRSAAVSYIWQAFGKPSAKASSFTDVPANASYAKAVNWAVEKEVTKGTNPEGTACSGINFGGAGQWNEDCKKQMSTAVWRSGASEWRRAGTAGSG